MSSPSASSSCRGGRRAIRCSRYFLSSTAWRLAGKLSVGSQPPHTHAHDRLCSRTIRLPQVVLDRQAFIKAITSLPSSIFRVKGLIELSSPRQTTLLQYVAGRWDITPFPGPQAEDRFLTFIGKTEGPDPFEAVEALLRAAEA